MGWQGTVLDVNTTAGVAYKLSLYMVSSVKPASKATWSFTKQAIRVMDLATLVTRRQLPLAMDNHSIIVSSDPGCPVYPGCPDTIVYYCKRN